MFHFVGICSLVGRISPYQVSWTRIAEKLVTSRQVHAESRTLQVIAMHFEALIQCSVHTFMYYSASMVLFVSNGFEPLKKGGPY